jgi:hypothetical protein
VPYRQVVERSAGRIYCGLQVYEPLRNPIVLLDYELERPFTLNRRMVSQDGIRNNNIRFRALFPEHRCSTACFRHDLLKPYDQVLANV